MQIRLFGCVTDTSGLTLRGESAGASAERGITVLQAPTTSRCLPDSGTRLPRFGSALPTSPRGAGSAPDASQSSVHGWGWLFQVAGGSWCPAGEWPAHAVGSDGYNPYHGTGDLRNRLDSSHSGGWRSKIKVLTEWVSGEASPNKCSIVML